MTEKVEKPPANPILKKEKAQPEEELSEEDKALKEELEMLIERLSEPKKDLYKSALEAMKTSIRSATSSMTSVPKPLKFLKPHYPTLIEIYNKWSASEIKRFLSDILSLLAMTYGEPGKRDSLKFRFSGSTDSAESWGHEYCRHLSAEIIAEYASRSETDQNTDDLIKLALELVPFFLSHNAEADAVDLLIEIEKLDKLIEYIDKETYPRVCLYIVGCIPYVAPPDDILILQTAHSIYRKFGQYADALQLSIKLRDNDLIKSDIDSCPDKAIKKQLAFCLGRSMISFETEDQELVEIISNSTLSEHFINLGRDLDILEPKIPEDIYKRHLENIKSNISVKIDSAKQNLASSFVNGFVNLGFGTDKLLSGTEEGSNWIYKNKDSGMMSATASLGLIHLWNVEQGAAAIDKYTYSQDDNIKSGALMALGIISSNVRNESDPALAILSEYVNDSKLNFRIASIFGLGVAYAGTAREDVLELLLPVVADSGLSIELCSIAALSLGLVFVGTCHGDICSTIIQTLMERQESPTDFKDFIVKFMGLGLGLLFIGKQESADAILETLKAIEHPISKEIEVMVEICAYAGTGNVLKIQKMLHLLNDHLDPEKENDGFQAIATIGVALIAMGEEIGSEMAFRTFNHLIQYGEPVIKRSVPLALGLLCASNPRVNVLDILGKCSHDNDQDTSLNAIFAMGLVGAGTNNARLAQMLRQLATYYHKEPNPLFVIRIAQGLLHMGKGTLTLNPFYSNRLLMNPIAVGGLLSVLIAFTNPQKTILGNQHWFLYYLVTAIYPRFLITLDEDLKPLPVTVRVGQAVDTIGQAGKPKTITGFQTHTTPVLLGSTERAELGTEEWIPLSKTLEGFVLLKKNPDFMDEDNDMQGNSVNRGHPSFIKRQRKELEREYSFDRTFDETTDKISDIGFFNDFPEQPTTIQTTTIHPNNNNIQ